MSKDRRILIVRLVLLSLMAAAGFLAMEMQAPGIGPVAQGEVGPPYTHCPVYPCGGGPPPMCIQRACDEVPIE